MKTRRDVPKTDRKIATTHPHPHTLHPASVQ